MANVTTFPRWKYVFLICVLGLGLIYSLPNLYGEDPAVQISGLKGKTIDENVVTKVQETLKFAELTPKSALIEEQGALLVRFKDTEVQLKAKDVIKQKLGEDYSVALNLAPVTPHWLQILGASPMKLGLDLRGGVHFLMEVDVDSVVARRMDGYYSEAPKVLQEAHTRYTRIERTSKSGYTLSFDNADAYSTGQKALQKDQFELVFNHSEQSGQHVLAVTLSEHALKALRNDIMEQTLSTLRNRINELGVSEPIVQRHGVNRIVVELPGIQDTAYAKDILGKTATLKFMMVDRKHDLQTVLSGKPAAGSKIYFDRRGAPVLLNNKVILTGDAITGATTGQDRDGRPAVNIRLGGDISLFSKTTRDNIGQPMATIYVEIKDKKIEETVINVATITSALGNNFQITGVKMQESRDLALLLRAGALPAALSIVEERIVGPSMGQENIRMGMISVGVGMALVLVFMMMYYSVFGLVANIALIANLILLVALMSLIGATLTLPGIAGIVLTLGMAVDANVLIFERIREELRLGLSPQASIHRGFEYAFATIIDSNLTTLIVGVILFAVGSGPVKGFAVTLCLGILTSLLTATTGSRALVNLLYSKRNIKRIRVGI
jgi:preprotein translocase subunit SecD